MAKRYYGDHEDYGGEVDHAELVERLVDEHPDGWALSTSPKTLQLVLALCPPTVRIGAWVRPVRPHWGDKRAQQAWEPVIFFRGRPRPADAPPLLNWVYAPLIKPGVYPGGVVGMKPPEFSWWIFDCLGAQAGDELVDVFPGSGAVGRAWERYQRIAWGEASRPAGPGPSDVSAAGRRPRLGRDASRAPGASVAAGSTQLDIYDALDGEEAAA